MSQPFPDIPGYSIERVIGEGGMATVYLARQLSLDRPVAVKLMVPEASAEETQAQRFEAEARVIARLEHPNIVGIHEVGRTDQGQLYYVMPFLPNGDLAHRNLGDDPMRIVEILHALLDALGYAHARGIVHRDVKAENVLFDASNRPRLADFGIALSRRTGKPRITTDGLALGSSGYMAPEQARGEALDGRADLYSVGVLTYELLTGELPFQAEDALALALMHDQDPVPRLPADRRHWQAFIDKAMAKKPSQRFRNAPAMLRALGAVERAIRRRMRGSAVMRVLARAGLTRASPLTLAGGGLLLAFATVLLLASWWRTEPRPMSVQALDSTPSAPPESRIDDAVAELLEQAQAQAQSGALVTPAGANAAESILAALRIDPLNSNASLALQGVFDALAQRAAEALGEGDHERVRESVDQAGLLADGLGPLGEDSMQRLRQRLLPELQDIAETAIAGGQHESLKALLALSVDLALDDGTLAGRLSQAVAATRVGALLRDRDGPLLQRVPAEVAVGEQRARRGGPLLAMAATVSVAEFAGFVERSGHQPSRCRALLSPLRLVDQRSWEDPGFSQSPDDSVVCVSPADAEAYATWLSRRTGERYRLPDPEELQHLLLFARSPAGGGSAANVAEWTRGCASGRDGQRDCARRLALDPGPDGRRWPLEQRPLDAQRGYDDVSFRLIREAGDAAPAALD